MEEKDPDEIEEEEEIDPTDFTQPNRNKVVKQILIEGNDRITSTILTLEEMTSILETRVAEIEELGNIFCDYEGLTNSKDIAIYELLMRKCPYKIYRDLYQRNDCVYSEVWDPNEMRIPSKDLLRPYDKESVEKKIANVKKLLGW